LEQPTLDDHDNEPAVPSPLTVRAATPAANTMDMMNMNPLMMAQSLLNMRSPNAAGMPMPPFGNLASAASAPASAAAAPKKLSFLDRIRTPLMVLLALLLSVLYMSPYHFNYPITNLLLVVLSIEAAISFPSLVSNQSSANSGATSPAAAMMQSLAAMGQQPGGGAATNAAGGGTGNMIEQALQTMGTLFKVYGVFTQVWRDVSVFVFVLVCACTVLAHPTVDTLLWGL
jgi:hypothetical protein